MTRNREGIFAAYALEDYDDYDAFLWRCALPDDLASTLAWSEVDMSDVKVEVPRMPDLPPAPVVVPTAPQPAPDAIVMGTPAPPAGPAQPRIEPQRIAIEILSQREGERSFARTVRELSIPLDHRLTHGEFCAAGSRKATPIRVVWVSDSAPPRYVALLRAKTPYNDYYLVEYLASERDAVTVAQALRAGRQVELQPGGGGPPPQGGAGDHAELVRR